MIERTLVILKPDALERGLHRVVCAELLKLGLKLGDHSVRARLEEHEVRDHYAAYAEAPFFPGILAYMTRGPVALMVWYGEDAVAKIRALAGATRPDEAAPGTLRARFGRLVDGRIENVLHCSATEEEAEAEITRFFGPARPA